MRSQALGLAEAAGLRPAWSRCSRGRPGPGCPPGSGPPRCAPAGWRRRRTARHRLRRQAGPRAGRAAPARAACRADPAPPHGPAALRPGRRDPARRADRPNVIVTRTALHRATAGRLAAARAEWAARLAHLPRPLVAVLVGGSNGRFRLEAAEGAALARQLAGMMRADRVGLAVTPSRRTAPAVRRALHAALAPLGAEVWDGDGGEPVFRPAGLRRRHRGDGRQRVDGVGGGGHRRARAAGGAAGPLAPHRRLPGRVARGRPGAPLRGAARDVARPRRWTTRRRRPIPCADAWDSEEPCWTSGPSTRGRAATCSTRRWPTRWPPRRWRGWPPGSRTPLAVYDPDGVADALFALHPEMPRARRALRPRHGAARPDAAPAARRGRSPICPARPPRRCWWRASTPAGCARGSRRCCRRAWRSRRWTARGCPTRC